MANKNNQYAKLMPNLSSFDGGLLGQIGTGLLSFLVFLVPLLPIGAFAAVAFGLLPQINPNLLILAFVLIGVFGFFMIFLGAAWSQVVVIRWEVRHCIVDGKRLTFKGTVRGLWGSYLKWFFLTLITLSIYGLWIGIKMRKWVLANVTAEGGAQENSVANNTLNVYMPSTNPYCPPMSQACAQPQGQPMQAPFMPNQPMQGQFVQGQANYPYYPPYPYFPPMPPYPYGNSQNQNN